MYTILSISQCLRGSARADELNTGGPGGPVRGGRHEPRRQAAATAFQFGLSDEAEAPVPLWNTENFKLEYHVET